LGEGGRIGFWNGGSGLRCCFLSLTFSPPMPSDPVSDLAALLRLYAHADALWQRPDVLERPAAGRWSAGEHLHHVEMTNRGVLGALRYIETGRGQDAQTAPPARAFLERGDFGPPRQAPAMVQPPDDLDVQTAADLRQSNHARWQALDPGSLRTWSGAVAHPALGPLEAADWLRFALVHTRHHHALAQR
jgi:hypothetical protein